MDSDPLVSVIIPCYNPREDFLRECLQSVAAQTLARWEAIVVDDGSIREDVERVVKELGDARFMVIRHSGNRGLGASRNTGFRSARAKLVLPLDADDRLDPSYLEATVQALRDHPEADWALVDYQLFGDDNDVWRFPVPLPPPCPAHFLYVGSGALVRRALWETVGGYSEDESLSGGEDLDFWLGAAEKRRSAVHIPRLLYHYRRHRDSMTFTTALYNSHISTDAIYTRHRRAFETLSSDCPLCRGRNRGAAVRAQGYLNSSIASLRRGERRRAIWLAIRSLILDPRNKNSTVQLIRTLLPGRLRAILRKLERAGD